MTLPFRQKKAEDQEIPTHTEKVQVIRAGGGSSSLTRGGGYHCHSPALRTSWREGCGYSLGGGRPAHPQAWSQIPGVCILQWPGPLCLVFSMPLRPPQKPRRLLTRDQGDEQSSRMQKGRSQPHTAQMTQTEPPEAITTKTEQTTQRAREFKSPVATHPAWSGPEARPQR